MKDPNQENDPIREHTFDGIKEYDKSLPNWWLFTLYSSIVFAIAYWLYYEKTHVGAGQNEMLEEQLALIEETKLQARLESPELTDEKLWAMSQDAATVEEGKRIYAANCVACHGPSLKGAIGVSLVDTEWIHGSEPLAIRHTVNEGFLAKGMPPWGPVLGDDRVSQVTAFILSFHRQQ